MTETDNIDPSSDKYPSSPPLSSRSQRIAVIKHVLDCIAVILSLIIGLFVTYELLAPLPLLLARIIGVLCFILVAALSRKLIAWIFGDTSDVVGEIISSL